MIRTLEDWCEFNPRTIQDFADYWRGKFKHTHSNPVFINVTIGDSFHIKEYHVLTLLDAAMAATYLYETTHFWDYIIRTSFDIETEEAIDQVHLVQSALLLVERIQNEHPNILPIEAFHADLLYESMFDEHVSEFMTSLTRRYIAKNELVYVSWL